MDAFAPDLAANEAGVSALGYVPLAEIPVFGSEERRRGLTAHPWGSDRILLLARSDCDSPPS